MSWGIQFTPDVFIPRISFENKEALLWEITSTKVAIDESTSKLLMLAASTPKDVIIPEEGEDCLIVRIRAEVDSTIDDLSESLLYLHSLEMFLQHLEDNPEADIKSFNH